MTQVNCFVLDVASFGIAQVGGHPERHWILSVFVQEFFHLVDVLQRHSLELHLEVT